MMKKWFIAIFIICLVFILIYQEKYLNHLRTEAQYISSAASNPSKTIIGKGDDFKILFYDKSGYLNAEMSGNQITYFEDATFKADGNLVYKTFDEDNKLINTIKTNSAFGIFENRENIFLFSGNTQLKSLELPENLSFNFNGNEGTTKNVFIDAINRTISSPEHIESHGSDGQFSANGFFYDIDKKDFKFNSKVRGLYKKNKNNENKQ